jgi:hypothetical protein
MKNYTVDWKFLLIILWIFLCAILFAVLVVPSEILVTYFKCLAFLFCIFLPGVLDCALTKKINGYPD